MLFICAAQGDHDATHLGALEEAGAPAHEQADAGLGQGLLDGLGLGARAVEDGDLAQRHPRVPQPADLGDDPGGLGLVVVEGLEADGLCYRFFFLIA